MATGEASLEGESRSQLRRKDSPLKLEPLVGEVKTAIVEHMKDPRLKWDGDHKVRILIESVIPATNQQTTSARRKRFWNALEEKIKPQGWIRLSARSSFFQKQA